MARRVRREDPEQEVQEERLCCNKITSKSVNAYAYTETITVEDLSMCSAYKHVYIYTATDHAIPCTQPNTYLLSLPCLNSVLVLCTETAEWDVHQFAQFRINGTIAKCPGGSFESLFS